MRLHVSPALEQSVKKNHMQIGTLCKKLDARDLERRRNTYLEKASLGQPLELLDRSSATLAASAVIDSSHASCIEDTRLLARSSAGMTSTFGGQGSDANARFS